MLAWGPAGAGAPLLHDDKNQMDGQKEGHPVGLNKMEHFHTREMFHTSQGFRNQHVKVFPPMDDLFSVIQSF